MLTGTTSLPSRLHRLRNQLCNGITEAPDDEPYAGIYIDNTFLVDVAEPFQGFMRSVPFIAVVPFGKLSANIVPLL